MSSGISSIFYQLAQTAVKDGIQKFVVGGVISNEKKVLIMRRKSDDFMPGIYEIPSGGVDPGETLDVALIREIMEETSLTVAEIGRHLGNFDYSSASGKNARQFNFIVMVKPPYDIKLTEHDDYVWCPEDQLGLYNITPKTLSILQAFFKGEKESR